MAHILVVDDEEHQLHLLATGLRLEGFDVCAAQTADRALALLDEQPVDLAVLDLMMPGINGIELARRVRQNHPRVRVVLTSAYHVSERQLARADCGVVGFVPKPFELVELAGFLRAKLAPASQSTLAAIHSAAVPALRTRPA